MCDSALPTLHRNESREHGTWYIHQSILEKPTLVYIFLATATATATAEKSINRLTYLSARFSTAAIFLAVYFVIMSKRLLTRIISLSASYNFNLVNSEGISFTWLIVESNWPHEIGSGVNLDPV